MPDVVYSDEKGYGFDLETAPRAFVNAAVPLDCCCISDAPFFFSIKLPEGNYEVKVVAGSVSHATSTTIRYGSRRAVVDNLATAPAEFKTEVFGVNIRTPAILPSQDVVQLNEREYAKLNWHNKLTIEFNGDRPAVSTIEITRQRRAVTLFLAGNSTLADHDDDPYSSWGQQIPRYFKSSCIIANHAELGLSVAYFITQFRLSKILSVMRRGDFVFLEFGHIDKKDKRPGALNEFRNNLVYAMKQIDAKGGVPVLVTPACRRFFNPDGTVVNTLGHYPETIRELAALSGAPLIDLNKITQRFLEDLGEEAAKRAYVWYRKGSWSWQVADLEDNTHFSVYGACQVARYVLDAIRETLPSLATYIRPGFAQPANSAPDDYRLFRTHVSPLSPVARAAMQRIVTAAGDLHEGQK